MPTRAVTIADVAANAANVPYANQQVIFQLYSTAQLLKYHDGIVAEELRTYDPVYVDTNSVGFFTVGLDAPGDLLGIADTGSFDPHAFYVITLPGGQRLKTKSFVWTGSTLNFSDPLLLDLSSSTTFPTAPIHIKRGDPDNSAPNPITIRAYLSDPGYIAGVYLSPTQAWTYDLPFTGDGTMMLPPNTLITPGGTSWRVFIGDDPVGIDITFGALGGELLNLLVVPPVAGSPVEDPSDGGTNYIHITGAGTVSTSNLVRVAWLHTVAGGGVLGNVKIYDAATAVGTPIYDDTPAAVTHQSLQIPLVSTHMTVVTAAATDLLITVF